MKKTVGQVKNGLPGPGQNKDKVTAVQKVSYCTLLNYGMDFRRWYSMN